MDIIFLWPTLNCVHVVDVWICPPIINNIAKKTRFIKEWMIKKRWQQHPNAQQVHNTICYYNKWVMGLTRLQQHESWEYETHKNFNIYISITWGKCKWKWYNFCWFFFRARKKRVFMNVIGAHKSYDSRPLALSMHNHGLLRKHKCFKGNAFSCWEHKWPH